MIGRINGIKIIRGEGTGRGEGDGDVIPYHGVRFEIHGDSELAKETAAKDDVVTASSIIFNVSTYVDCASRGELRKFDLKGCDLLDVGWRTVAALRLNLDMFDGVRDVGQALAFDEDGTSAGVGEAKDVFMHASVGVKKFNF